MTSKTRGGTRSLGSRGLCCSRFTCMVRYSGLDVQATTHNHRQEEERRRGGAIGVINTRQDLIGPLSDVGLLDPHLLGWSVGADWPPNDVIAVSVGLWCKIDIEKRYSAPHSSVICQLDVWPDEDNMATPVAASAAETAYRVVSVTVIVSSSIESALATGRARLGLMAHH